MFADAEGPLRPPSDAYFVWHFERYGNSMADGYWNGAEWVQQQDSVSGDFEGGRPKVGRWFRTGSMDGEIHYEGFIGRATSLPEYDSLQLAKGSSFRLALNFTRMFDVLNDGVPEGLDHDIWPGDGFTPNRDKDTHDWPVFRYGCAALV